MVTMNTALSMLQRLNNSVVELLRRRLRRAIPGQSQTLSLAVCNEFEDLDDGEFVSSSACQLEDTAKLSDDCPQFPIFCFLFSDALGSALAECRAAQTMWCASSFAKTMKTIDTSIVFFAVFLSFRLAPTPQVCWPPSFLCRVVHQDHCG